LAAVVDCKLGECGEDEEGKSVWQPRRCDALLPRGERHEVLQHRRARAASHYGLTSVPYRLLAVHHGPHGSVPE
jgi:hypothetical protein